MKRSLILILVGAALGAGAVWATLQLTHNTLGKSEAAAEKVAGAEEDKTSISRDAEGNVVIRMDDEMRTNIGIILTNPAAAHFSPELKGFGRVLDPAPLATLMTDLATAHSAYEASSNDLVRLKSLSLQGNASQRALQTAEATAQRDASTLQSARDRLLLSWGVALASQPNLPVFVQSLAALEKVLVRIDLPLGENLDSPPLGARLVTVSDQSIAAEFLGAASAVDPQFQGQGFLFLVPTNSPRMLPGETVTGYLKTAGETGVGVVIPRDAVVRLQGKGWSYFLSEDGKSFTRREIPLDHPTESGWLVSNTIANGRRVVVMGAQTLLSQEMKGSLSAD